MVEYLRFRKRNPKTCQLTFMTLKSIAKFLNRSTAYVQSLCQMLIAGDGHDNSVDKAPEQQKSYFSQFIKRKNEQFTKEQVEYLTNKKTLDKWVSKSLEERACLFKKRYPDSKVTVYKLRKLYTKFKIRKKAIIYGKIPKAPSLYDITV